jgi:hypothetical protein
MPRHMKYVMDEAPVHAVQHLTGSARHSSESESIPVGSLGTRRCAPRRSGHPADGGQRIMGRMGVMGEAE